MHSKLVSAFVVALLVVGTITGLSAAFYFSPAQLNLRNQATYLHDISTACTPQPQFEQVGGAWVYAGAFCGKANVILTTADKAANYAYLMAGFWASCLSNCNGITYKQDPTAIMTNNGHDFMFNCKDFGTASVITCTAADVATKMQLSTSSATPLVTDTSCASGITTGGLADVAGTFTAGTAGSGTVTSTLAHTWTAAETDSSVQLQCVNTELHTGGNIVLVYEFTFGPVSLVSGNTLAITDSLTAT